MAAKVFLARFKSDDNNRLQQFKKLLQVAQVDGVVAPNNLVALKTHVGEDDNDTYMSADYVAVAAALAKAKGGKPFATDTTVLYKSRRSNAVDHLELAAEHGFTREKLGCPFIIGDGLRGREEQAIRINGKHYQDVKLSSVVFDCDAIIVISHFTGHIAAGFGATIKNLGMGFASRKGKLNQHSGVSPFVNSKYCTACGLCVANCPEGAIVIESKIGKQNQRVQSAKINDKTCIGCGECLAICRAGAVAFKWATQSGELQEKIAEHALGVQRAKAGKIVYINLLCKVTGECDCMARKQTPVTTDIGALVSFDPVALDKASYDLFATEARQRIEQFGQENLNGCTQMEYGAAIGLGSLTYELIEVEQ